MYIQTCPLCNKLSIVIGFEIEEHRIFRVVENSWEVAPKLVNIGCTSNEFDKLFSGFQPAQFQVVVQWLDCTCEIYRLLADIGQTSTHISDIVKALKVYTIYTRHPSRTWISTHRVRQQYHHPAKQAQRYKGQAQFCIRFAPS